MSTDPQRKAAQRLAMRRLRANRAAVGVRERRLQVHDDDWQQVQEYSDRLLLQRMAKLVGIDVD